MTVNYNKTSTLDALAELDAAMKKHLDVKHGDRLTYAVQVLDRSLGKSGFLTDSCEIVDSAETDDCRYETIREAFARAALYRQTNHGALVGMRGIAADGNSFVMPLPLPLS